MTRSPAALVIILTVAACGEPMSTPDADQPSAVVGSGETVLRGSSDTEFDGVELRIPAGALPEGTSLEVRLADDDTPLPPGAHSVGRQFAVEPTSVRPELPIEATIPFDPERVDEFDQSPLMVKVWLRRPDLDKDWELIEQTASTDQTVTVELRRGGTFGPGVKVE